MSETPSQTPTPIPDLATGLRMLARLSLANPPQAERELNAFLDSLLQSPPAADVYLKLLEQARVSLCFVEEELARRFTSKPLPLAEIEENTFRDVVATWLKAARAYAHCAQLDAAHDDAGRAARIALILHRCIHYTSMAIVEHHRARRELPPGLWLDLHGYYASAEEWGVATLAVPDTLDAHGRSSHCTAALVSLLLCELAGPYSLSVRDQGLVRRWANSWAPLISVHRTAPGEPLPAFVIDLMQDVGLRPSANCPQPEQIRRLDTARLALQLAQVRQQLGQRIPPAQIGLGDGCSPGQCRRLLEMLFRPWTQTRAPRKFRRHAASGTVKVCIGFAAMHYAISGQEFTQPENVRAYSRQEFDSLFTFRHMVAPTQKLQNQQFRLGFTIDQWEVVNQSATGFRLTRSVAGQQMTHGQLLAVCPHDGGSYLLAKTTWLMQESGGGLVIGIAVLPGVPQAVAARPQSPQVAHAEKYSQAFLLPAVPAIGSERSLVLPQGWFHIGRIIDVHAEGSRRAKLLNVLDDGADFERASFVFLE